MQPIVYNFSRCTPNTGDRYCSPHLYFDFLKDCQVRGPHEWEPGPSIFGGGGLFHPGTDHHIARAVESGQPTVILGAGLNYHGVEALLYPRFLDAKNALVGMRESGNPWEYVPCPSCMADEFNNFLLPATHAFVVYEHGSNRILPLIWPTNAPSKINDDGSSLANVLSFLSMGAVVLTNTFHGAYWSMLIGRPVVLFEPFANRFLAIKTQVCDRGNWSTVLKQAQDPAPDYLIDCRKRNMDFAAKVKVHLGL